MGGDLHWLHGAVLNKQEIVMYILSAAFAVL